MYVLPLRIESRFRVSNVWEDVLALCQLGLTLVGFSDVRILDIYVRYMA